MFKLNIQLSNWTHIVFSSYEEISFKKFKLKPILLSGIPSDPNIKYKYAIKFGTSTILMYEYFNNDVIICLSPIPWKDEYNLKHLSVNKVYISFQKNCLFLKKKQENQVEIKYIRLNLIK